MWELDEGWIITNTECEFDIEIDCLDIKNETFYIYKGDEIWRFRNGRCAETTFKRFEDLMRKALKLAQKNEDSLFWLDGKVFIADGSLLVCSEHLCQLQELGFVYCEKIICPDKFNTAQKEYALRNAEYIRERIEWMEEEL